MLFQEIIFAVIEKVDTKSLRSKMWKTPEPPSYVNDLNITNTINWVIAKLIKLLSTQ